VSAIVPQNFATAAQIAPQVFGHKDAQSITQACFGVVLQLRRPLNGTDYQAVYDSIRQTIDALVDAPRAWELLAEDAQEIAYAVTAFADESAARGATELADFWRPRSLQLHYFSDNMAGEHFYQRLERLRQATAPGDALQAYYIALALGFEGRYGLQSGKHEIQALMGAIRQSLVATAALRFTTLSMHGVPEARAAANTRGNWRWTVPVLSVCALVALASVAMHYVVQQASARVVQAVDMAMCQGGV
jgi:type VI secretion system protein ImpK